MENFLFINFSFLAILGALGLISFKAPIHGALSMIVSLVAIAGLYLLLYAQTLFLIQIVVYAGAIMVLSVFVMMFFNIKANSLWAKFSFAQMLQAALPLVVFGFLVYELAMMPGDFIVVPEGFGQIAPLGKYLFFNWGFSFEMISLLLTAALVGVVAILKGKNNG